MALRLVSHRLSCTPLTSLTSSFLRFFATSFFALILRGVAADALLLATPALWFHRAWMVRRDLLSPLVALYCAHAFTDCLARAKRVAAAHQFEAARQLRWTVDSLHSVEVTLEKLGSDVEAQLREDIFLLDAQISSSKMQALLNTGEEAAAAARGKLVQGDLASARLDIATAAYAFEQALQDENRQEFILDSMPMCREDYTHVARELVDQLSRQLEAMQCLTTGKSKTAGRRPDLKAACADFQEGLLLLANEAARDALRSRDQVTVDIQAQLFAEKSTIQGLQGSWHEALADARSCYSLRPMWSRSISCG